MATGHARVGAVGHTPYYADNTIGNKNAGFHNSVYRGKYLGNSLSAAQIAAIQAGTFDDMFVGDYWTINGVNWRIAGFDTHYRTGDTSLTNHHVAVVPDSNLYSAKWNDSNTTSGGYVGSGIRTNIKAASGDAQGAEAKVIAAFGSTHVLAYRALYPTTYDANGKATGWAWTDAKVELMNETMVYGHQVWGQNSYEDGADKQQLPLFALNPTMVNIRADWWLCSVSSASLACYVSGYGGAGGYGASYSFGVRPLSLIG